MLASLGRAFVGGALGITGRPALRTAAGAAPARRANLPPHVKRAAPYRPCLLATAADRMGGQR